LLEYAQRVTMLESMPEIMGSREASARPAGAVARAATRGHGPVRRIAMAAAAVIVLLPTLALLIGFVGFAGAIERIEPVLEGRAEGMVALTGGADRIADAVDLLAQGRADRLLITGVNQTTTGAEIARLTPRFRSLFTCCIDLGYEALNTIGNATETSRWVRMHRIKSLIVVTSNYHMPRALLEIGSALPETALVPYPVVSERQRSGLPWGDAAMLRMVALEYVKYLAAVARMHLMPQSEPDDAVAAAAHT
jgi:uncharacterized SAM-binding protein YcdF (DUF218 family)